VSIAATGGNYGEDDGGRGKSKGFDNRRDYVMEKNEKKDSDEIVVEEKGCSVEKTKTRIPEVGKRERIEKGATVSLLVCRWQVDYLEATVTSYAWCAKATLCIKNNMFCFLIEKMRGHGHVIVAGNMLCNRIRCLAICVLFAVFDSFFFTV
jgi:hypothetical protein